MKNKARDDFLAKHILIEIGFGPFDELSGEGNRIHLNEFRDNVILDRAKFWAENILVVHESFCHEIRVANVLAGEQQRNFERVGFGHEHDPDIVGEKSR